MTIFAILTIKSGNFETGFNVSLAIKEEERLLEPEIDGFLPPNPQIYSLTTIQKGEITIDTKIGLYQNWHDWYITNLHSSARQLRNHGGITFLPTQKETKPDINPQKKCFEAAKKLKLAMRKWLAESDGRWTLIWVILGNALLKYSKQIQLVISIRNIESDELTKQLWKLPWHEWNILDNQQVDVGLNITPSIPLPEQLKRTKHSQIRILHILGDDQNLDLEKDSEIIKEVTNTAEIIPLIQPTHNEFVKTLQEDKKGFDIIVFSGHSTDDLGVGKFFIAENDSMEIEDLKYSFKTAIQYGLKLVIFNSCVSLSLAKAILNYGVSAVISMREEIPDQVAHLFLKTFFKNYIEGKSVYVALKESRIALEELEKDFGGATWLPIICQNLAIAPLLYQNLLPQIEQNKLKKLPLILTASLISIISVLGIRQIGLLEKFELKTYDLMLTSRPMEDLDQRILVVTIDENDLEIVSKNNPKLAQDEYTISDLMLAQVLDKLKSYNPRVIGLDIFRDISVGKGQKELINQFKSQDNLYVICQDIESNKPGNSPPPQVKSEFVTLATILKDINSDSVVRRQLLFQEEREGKSSCSAIFTLSFQLALHYLNQENYYPKTTKDNQIQINNKVFRQLTNPSGGYQNLDEQNLDGGYQILLNYRGKVDHSIEKISITDLLNRPTLAQQYQNKIILIGYNFSNFTINNYDVFQTPYGEMRGVFLHAQMVSQILSATFDNRPLIRTLPWWGDSLFIIVSGLLGGVLIYSIQRPFTQVIAIVITIIIVCYSYYLMFWLQGLWLPLIPSILVLSIPMLIITIKFKIDENTSLGFI